MWGGGSFPPPPGWPVHRPTPILELPACTQYLFQVVDLLDVATLGRLQLADVPVLISALLEERWGANLVAAHEYEKLFSTRGSALIFAAEDVFQS